MKEQFSRTEMLIGSLAMERLAGSRVAVFGIGGVGGYVCEALARSGVGAFELIDKDTVDITNLNRQIIATHKTVGRYKTEVMKERILDINPEAEVQIRNCFFLPENADEFRFEDYDYVVDAIDTVTAKIELIMRAQKAGTPVISAMGAGNKLDASRFRIADIYDTQVCPLARVMRKELKKRGVSHLKVVFSDETPRKPASPISGGVDFKHGNLNIDAAPDKPDISPIRRKDTPGSSAFVPAVAGLILAGEIIKDLSR